MELVAEKYKQTEVGLIPSDWEVFTFGDIINYTKGFAFKSRDYKKDGIRIIRVSDTTFDSIKKENGIYIDENDATGYKNWRLDENDLIFTTVGSKPPMYDSMVGKVIMVSKEFAGSFLNQNAVLIRAKKRTKYIQALLLSHFRMKRYLQHIELIYRGNANQASITLKELFEFKIPLPENEAEQTAIATALSDADALISSLEKLIAKKRMIKQGTMQQLLQPKEGWLNKSLGEIGEITGAGVDKLIVEGETPVRLVNYMDVFNRDFIYSKELNHWVTAPSHKANKCSVKQGDIFFTPSSEMRYDIAVSAVAMEDIPDAVYSYHLVRLRLFEDWDLNFRTYIFKTKYFLGQAEQICEGSGKRYVITLPKFRSMKIFYPPTKEEQTRIATILSDMDTEIAALETKLEKYRKVKLGMMQNLLTGKIRLI